MREELVELGGGAHALATQILGNPDDARDAVQDALATVLGRPAAYDAKKGPLKPWFLRIVRNRCIDLLRRRRPGDERSADIADPGRGPEEAAEIAERDLALEAALSALTPEQREIVILRDYLDLGYGEIAEVLQIPAGTVMSRLHRARVALGKAFRNRHDHTI